MTKNQYTEAEMIAAVKAILAEPGRSRKAIDDKRCRGFGYVSRTPGFNLLMQDHNKRWYTLRMLPGLDSLKMQRRERLYFDIV